jgi:hypothetical protein
VRLNHILRWFDTYLKDTADKNDHDAE